MFLGRNLDIKIRARSVPLHAGPSLRRFTSSPTIMRCVVRLFCVALIAATVGWWLAAGARVGWWQTRVGVERTDEFTGLSVIEWQDRFVPGVETPVAGVLVGGLGFVATLFFRRQLPKKQQPT